MLVDYYSIDYNVDSTWPFSLEDGLLPSKLGFDVGPN